MQEHKTRINEQGRYYTWVGKYKVVQESKTFCGVYNDYGGLVTSRGNWRSAIKIAKLLNEAYEEGKESMSGNLW